MPIPRFIAKINKRVFNPRQVELNRYPVLVHVGRRTGHTYRTPMDAYPTREGYVCVVRYGARSDWVQNALARGTAKLLVDGVEIDLTSPRMIGQEEARASLVEGLQVPRTFSTTDHYLHLERAGQD
jgi:deazaflavin-dependent oxidoreductase (nitroreductase family)